MRVGILTYQNALNIGAVLQAYALRTVIERTGHNCEIIDYRSAHLEKTYKSNTIKQVRSAKGLIKWLLNVKKDKSKKNKFEKFSSEYQILSKKVYYKNNIDESNNDYDIFIVGSDQVWNMNLNGNDTVYFLDFVKSDKVKISYAASFGYKKVPEQYLIQSQKGISEFNAISVRETAGKNIISKMISEEVSVVLDPTLLLEKNEWELMSTECLSEKDYILVYIIAATPTILEFSRKLGEKYDCEVICIHNSYIPKYGIKNIRDCSPIEFLSYIQHAKFVVSSSFHGICFSVLFEKEFFFELDDKKENNNSRIETLIENLGLWDRQIIEGDCESESNINYDKVGGKLSLLRANSNDFIQKSIDFESNGSTSRF